MSANTERYWIAVIGTVGAGAMIAGFLGFGEVDQTTFWLGLILVIGSLWSLARQGGR